MKRTPFRLPQKKIFEDHEIHKKHPQLRNSSGSESKTRIKKNLNSTGWAISHNTFCSIVRDIIKLEFYPKRFRIANNAMNALHTAAESYIQTYLMECHKYTKYYGQETLISRDMELRKIATSFINSY